jgi:hypothetical protein
MADHTLVLYEEPRNEEGPYWTLRIERAASRPGLFFTIECKMFDPAYASLNQKMVIVVDDGRALLAPVMEWLNDE